MQFVGGFEGTRPFVLQNKTEEIIMVVILKPRTTEEDVEKVIYAIKKVAAGVL